jgi:hypothetical protein
MKLFRLAALAVFVALAACTSSPAEPAAADLSSASLDGGSAPDSGSESTSDGESGSGSGTHSDSTTTGRGGNGLGSGN